MEGPKPSGKRGGAAGASLSAGRLVRGAAGKAYMAALLDELKRFNVEERRWLGSRAVVGWFFAGVGGGGGVDGQGV